MSCVVPCCKCNYRSQAEFDSTFHFPKDLKLREEWFGAIPRPRKVYEASTQMRPLGMRTSFQMASREPLPIMTGFVLLQFPEIIALNKTAVLSIFPNLPWIF